MRHSSLMYAFTSVHSLSSPLHPLACKVMRHSSLMYAFTPLHSLASPLHPLACTMARHINPMLCTPCCELLHSSVLCVAISSSPSLLQMAAVLMDLRFACCIASLPS